MRLTDPARFAATFDSAKSALAKKAITQCNFSSKEINAGLRRLATMHCPLNKKASIGMIRSAGKVSKRSDHSSSGTLLGQDICNSPSYRHCSGARVY